LADGAAGSAGLEVHGDSGVATTEFTAQVQGVDER
jgi:hypothetical protein